MVSNFSLKHHTFDTGMVCQYVTLKKNTFYANKISSQMYRTDVLVWRSRVATGQWPLFREEGAN